MTYYRGAATIEGHRRAGHGKGEPFGWGFDSDDPEPEEKTLREVPELETEEV